MTNDEPEKGSGEDKHVLSSLSLAQSKRDAKHLTEIKRRFEDELVGFNEKI